jgi:predicted Zn-dependent protease
MDKEQKAHRICEDILQRSGKDPAEVLLLWKEQALTRFANNAIHQNVAEHNLTLILRLFRDRRIGMATTNQLDADTLERVVACARANAEASPENPDYPGLPEPAIYASVHTFDQSTASYPPESRAKAVGLVCGLAAEKGLNAAGAFSIATNGVAVANSQGLFAYHPSTNADFQIVVTAEDASGWAQGSGWRVGEIPIESLGREAIQKAERGRNPCPIHIGEYSVVLAPYATEDLLTSLNYYGIGAQAVLEGRSWMVERMGEKAMNDLVNIWDDGLDPDGVPLPFDFEGVPKHRVDIVQKGVVKNPVFDRITANKMGETSTGHALPPTMQSFGPMAINLFMSPGTLETEELIRSTQRGLYITRFWYTRLVHPRDCVVTGMTRDGVFMIESGELTHPVKNLRFTQSYVEALANLEIVGRETRLLMSEFGGSAIRVPALKISQFKFTGSTV